MRLLGIAILLFIKPLLGFSQGLYFLQNYEPKTYDNFRQNWSIAQDNSGYLFFGNSDGLIGFNSVEWKSTHTPNEQIVRTLRSVEEDVFWGGRGEFGYITRDSLNNFLTKKIDNDIPHQYQDFSDVWQVINQENHLYLRTYEGIYVIKPDTIEVVESSEKVRGIFSLGNDVIVQDDNQLAYLRNNQLVPIDASEFYADDRLYVVLPLHNQHLLISRKQGFKLFDGRQFSPFETEADDYVKEHLIYRGTYINDSQIALATLTGGIVIINTDGSLHTTLTEEDGMPTNIIYDLYVDREETLWAATDNGIVKILVNNPVTKLDKRSGFRGIPTFIESIGSRTYFGSTEGISYSDRLGQLTEVAEIKNRIYDGLRSGDAIIVSTPEGLYQIHRDNISLLSSSGYHLLKGSGNNVDLFFGASNDSVYAIKKRGSQVEETDLFTVPGHVHDLYVNQEELWVVTANEGVYHYSREGSLESAYTLPTSEDQELHRLDFLGGHLRLGTDAGLFVYNPQVDSFVVDTTFQDPELSRMQVNRFRQCAENEIWFRNNRKVKRAIYDSGHWNVIEDSYRLIDEGETITAIHCGDDNSVWFGGTAGIYHLSDPDWEYNRQFNTNITGLLVRGDSLIYGGYGEPDRLIELSYDDNELRFTYGAASYIAPGENTYRTRLRGYDESWSSWTPETEKDYTFIPEGTYTFEVQGRNIYHKAGTIDSFTFTILPPWYRTWWAYTLYTLLFGSLIYGGHKLRINQILREQRIRNRIASDLHDDVSATLSSISYFAQAIRQMQDSNQTERFVKLISESAFEAKEKISDIIWSIDPEHDDWVSLLSKCRRFASDLFESKGMDYELDIDTDIARPLDVELRQHLWLIFKEMVVNAARHSEAKRVDLFFGIEDGRLKLVVQDDGMGIPEKLEKKSGHGIKNIHQRARQIGAEIRLETDRDIGTRWIMFLNL